MQNVSSRRKRVKRSVTRRVCANQTSVDPERVCLNGCGRVVQSVSVLCGLPLQAALVVQSAGAAVAEEAVVSDELYLVALVTRLDAVDTDGIALCRVACLAPVHIHTSV
jgi:hypothetical protein